MDNGDALLGHRDTRTREDNDFALNERAGRGRREIAGDAKGGKHLPSFAWLLLANNVVIAVRCHRVLAPTPCTHTDKDSIDAL